MVRKGGSTAITFRCEKGSGCFSRMDDEMGEWEMKSLGVGRSNWWEALFQKFDLVGKTVGPAGY